MDEHKYCNIMFYDIVLTFKNTIYILLYFGNFSLIYTFFLYFQRNQHLQKNYTFLNVNSFAQIAQKVVL